MIHLICNNANSKKDGIGDYSYHLYKALQREFADDVFIHSASSGIKGRLEKVLSFKMSQVLARVSCQLKANDIVILEYPFVECNILILLFLWVLKAALLRQNGVFVLSLHEYERVNFLRKFITRHFISSADLVLVTDKQTKSWISSKYHKPVFIRTIPSNIFEKPEAEINKNRKAFIYFGLITKAKAIDEMLQAWKIFNSNQEYTLYFLTSSQFTNDYEQYGVKYLPNLSNTDVVRYFCKAAFSILPIMPSVSVINASYKTSLLYHCIPIGHFDEEISAGQFGINVNGNSVDDLLQGLKESQELGESEYAHKISIIKKLPQATFEKTASQYKEAIESYSGNFKRGSGLPSEDGGIEM